jgi:hypothetical protein
LVELRRVGATRLLLSALVERRSDLRLVSEAIPGAAITVIRLRRCRRLSSGSDCASPLLWRANSSGRGGGLSTSMRCGVEDYVVETENRSVDEIAREVLRLVDWLP